MIDTNNPFDRLAEAYDEFRSGYSRALYDLLFEHGLKAGSNLLDVACGTGLASEPLAKRGVNITGVDISEPMLAKARMRFKNGEFVRGEAESLPFGDKTFDATICAQAIHWLDQRKALAEMVRVVRPGGRVAIWWKAMSTEEPMRVLREEAAQAVGVTPPKDLMAPGFRAFFEAPFKERRVRVLPHVIMTDVDRWLGYERSRARQKEYGDQFPAYLVELEQKMRDLAAGKPFKVEYAQFIYVGEV